MTAAEIAPQLGNAAGGGNEWRCDCPVCHHHNLTLRDGKKRLLVHCFNGCANQAVLAALRQRKLYGKGNPNGADRSEPPGTAAEHQKRIASAKAKREIKIAAALDIWRNAHPAADTMATVYLASRLILAEPTALRFTRQFWSKEAGINYPALLGLIEHQTEGPIGVHAILLNPLDASVRVTLADRKQSRGFVKGGAVRLAPVGPVLGLAEGVEDALTYTQATGTPCWAAISGNGIRHFIPPPLEVTSTLILLEDQDANRAGQEAVANAARRLSKAGYQIQIARPTAGKDVNDALLALGLNEPLVTIANYDPGGRSGDWYARTAVGADGRTLSNLGNAVLALREDRAWRGALLCNGLLDATLLTKKSPNIRGST